MLTLWDLLWLQTIDLSEVVGTLFGVHLRHLCHQLEDVDLRGLGRLRFLQWLEDWGLHEVWRGNGWLLLELKWVARLGRDARQQHFRRLRRQGCRFQSHVDCLRKHFAVLLHVRRHELLTCVEICSCIDNINRADLSLNLGKVVEQVIVKDKLGSFVVVRRDLVYALKQTPSR